MTPAAASAASSSGQDDTTLLPATKFCRICHGTDPVLVAPCLCKGSMQFVHGTCLDLWRIEATSEQALWICEMCSYTYDIKKMPPRTRQAAITKKQQQFGWCSQRACLVVALVFAVSCALLACATCIGALGFLAMQLLYRTGHKSYLYASTPAAAAKTLSASRIATPLFFVSPALQFFTTLSGKLAFFGVLLFSCAIFALVVLPRVFRWHNWIISLPFGGGIRNAFQFPVFFFVFPSSGTVLLTVFITWTAVFCFLGLLLLLRLFAHMERRGLQWFFNRGRATVVGAGDIAPDAAAAAEEAEEKDDEHDAGEDGEGDGLQFLDHFLFVAIAGNRNANGGAPPNETLESMEEKKRRRLVVHQHPVKNRISDVLS